MFAADVVIVGTGHGGAQAALTPRQLGFDESIALDCVNRPRDFVHGRKLVEGRAVIDRNKLADGDRPLIS